MNYLVYPTQTMKITQNHTEGNHKNHTDFPFDEACEDTGRSPFYCPCDEMKVIRIYTTGINTIWLQSTAPVVMPCGTAKVVLMVEHPETEDFARLKVGQVFKRGQQMFREGKDGATGNHFHISVGIGDIRGNGWEQNAKGAWVLAVTGTLLKADEAFYLDGTKVMNAAGYKFKEKPKEVTAMAKVTAPDNTADAYAAEAVAWAKQNGILFGDDTGNLKLHDAVTRQDMLVFLYRAMKTK